MWNNNNNGWQYAYQYQYGPGQQQSQQPQTPGQQANPYGQMSQYHRQYVPQQGHDQQPQTPTQQANAYGQQYQYQNVLQQQQTQQQPQQQYAQGQPGTQGYQYQYAYHLPSQPAQPQQRSQAHATSSLQSPTSQKLVTQQGPGNQQITYVIQKPSESVGPGPHGGVVWMQGPTQWVQGPPQQEPYWEKVEEPTYPPKGYNDPPNSHLDYENCIASHNRARAKEGLKGLLWNDDLAREAEQWAKYLAAKDPSSASMWDRMQHSSGEDRGENLFVGAGPQHRNYGVAVGHWLSEEEIWRRRGCPAFGGPGDEAWGHWCQCMWKDTTHVGMGKAMSSRGECFIVARYYPQGNYIGEKPY
jgi:hypothetical protein